MTDGQIFFDPPVRNDLITYDSIRKIGTGQGDDYTAGCLLDYNYFKKLKLEDHSKQQALDAHQKVIQQINFNGNLDWPTG